MSASITIRQISLRPSVLPGKWHEDSFGVAACDPRIEIDRHAHEGSIVVFASVDIDTVHPIACRRCLKKSSRQG